MHAKWFDGQSAGAHDVHVSADKSALIIRDRAPDDPSGQVIRQFPITDIRWPERTVSGSRILRLPDGSSLQAEAGANWSTLADQAGIRETSIVRWQQSTRLAIVAVLLVVATGVVGYIWGVPLAAQTALRFVPQWVDEKVGNQFIETFGPRIVSDSTLEQARKAQISHAFDELVTSYYRSGTRGPMPGYDLRFYRSKVGANAFALPGGIIIMTDELVRMADGNTDMVLGVLAHELGHVSSRHGMRMLSQTLLIGLVTAVVLGDYGDLVATIPLLLGQTAYSRDFEREADEHAISMLLAGGKSPEVMADFFVLLEGTRPGTPAEQQHVPGGEHGDDPTQADDENPMQSLGVLISSHPASAERIQRFRQAAQTGR